MPSSSAPTSPPRRPRLSLQIKAISSGTSTRTSRALAAAVDVKDLTTFNTLSNVYATAIDRSTPVLQKDYSLPIASAMARPSVRVQTHDLTQEWRFHYPFLVSKLDTPLSAQEISSPIASRVISLPSAAMIPAPPLCAQPGEKEEPAFSPDTRPAPHTSRPSVQTLPSPKVEPRQRTTFPTKCDKPPYTHSRSLRSILRNSPLPPLSTSKLPPYSSHRLQERGARRVAYHSPLCQTITNSKYTCSHVDLLSGDVSPFLSANVSRSESVNALDVTLTGAETRDGGQTPGPFEEMRRRMTGVKASSPLSPALGVCVKNRGKARKRDRKRRWVWTIGEDAEDASTGSEMDVSSPVMAVSAGPVAFEAEKMPVPVIAAPSPRPKTRFQMAGVDVEMSDASSFTSDIMGDSGFSGFQQADYEDSEMATTSEQLQCRKRLGEENMVS